MPNTFKVALCALWIAAVTSSAIAQKRPESKKPSRSEPGKVATAEEPVFQRFRVTTDQGTFVVYDADETWDGREDAVSQLAYWNDFASEQFFFFDQLLFTEADVLQSIAAMQRDLQIDPAQVLSEKPEFNPLPVLAGPGQWRPAIEEDVLAVMAGGQPGAREGGVSGALQTHLCPEDCIAVRPPSGPIPGPVRGAQAEDLVVLVRRQTYCWCDPDPGGGCGPTGPCSTGNPCTTGQLCRGICVPYPLTGPCQNDSDPCTNDVCSEGVCTHPPKCDDGDPCTTDVCDSEGNCHIGPIEPAPDATGCENCHVHMDLPAWIAVNDDDDNHNGVPDFQDPGPVPDEYDMKSSIIENVTGCPSQSCAGGIDWHICERGGNFHYKIFETRDKTGLIDHDGSPASMPVEDRVYFEGVAASECPIPVYFWFNYGECCWDEVGEIDVVGITSLAWEKAPNSGNSNLEPCPNNGGLRIFPDKLSPTDNPQPPLSPTIRQEVELVATITPPIAGVFVKFRVFDVDDPFDQLHGPNSGLPDPIPGTPENEAIIPDVEMIDTQNTSDNRTAVGDPDVGVHSTETEIEPDGVARARQKIRITMQPGNNYRAVASLHQEAVLEPQVTQAMADALSVKTNAAGKFVQNGGFSGYKCPATWSQMLTVWRKLHVEVDSMSAEPTTVSARDPDWGAFDPVNIIDGTATTSFEGVNGASLPAGEIDHYEGGLLSFLTPLKNYFVRGNHTYFDPNWGNLTRIPCDGGTTPGEEAQLLAGPPGTVRDDDPISGQLPVYYPVATDPTIKSAYAAAYIAVEEVSMALNLDRETAFKLAVPDIQTFFGVGWDNSQNVFSSSGYWGAFIVLAYQPGSSEDGDPDPFTGIANAGLATNPNYDEGFVYGISHSDSDNASLIFVEVHRDVGAVASSPTSHDLAHTIAHEMGHTAGSSNDADIEHVEGGIMSPGAPVSECCFTGPTLRRFREAVTW